MDDPKKSSSSLSIPLPPGCRFYPSEDEIFQYYLRLKNSPTTSDESDACGVISEINSCNLNPFELPDVASFRFGYRGRKRHWYFYMERVNCGGGVRRAGLGFWKRKGKVRDVIGEAGVVLGRRTFFVFYSVDSKSGSGNRSKGGVKTDWLMYEYDLVDTDKAFFVLCRIFFKSHRQNYLLEHDLRCAEEKATTVCHIGIQHDGGVASNTGEDDILDSPDKNEIGLVDESFQIPSDSQLSNLVRSSELARDNAILENAFDAQLSKYILEEDYIELDDLV